MNAVIVKKNRILSIPSLMILNKFKMFSGNKIKIFHQMKYFSIIIKNSIPVF